jgi:hypothetical protein
MKKILTTTALASALILSANYGYAQTTVTGQLDLGYRAYEAKKTGKTSESHRGFTRETQINVQNKGKLSNGIDYTAGFAWEIDGSESVSNGGTAADNAGTTHGAFSENTYINFISGNTTLHIGADHIQNPNFEITNLAGGVTDIDDAVQGVSDSTTNKSLAGIHSTNTGLSASQAHGVGIIQTIPNIGKISVNYTPDRTTGLANGDTLSVNTTNNKATQYDTGNSAYEIGFVGDLGVKGLQVQAFMNKSDSGIATFADLKGEMYGARYNFGQITVAAQRAKTKSAAAVPITVESDSFGVAYAVTPALSVGVSYGKTDKTATTADETIKQLSVGYNLGPVTVGASFAKVSDLGNTTGVDGDTFVLQASTRF